MPLKKSKSPLEKKRLTYQPNLPSSLRDLGNVCFLPLDPLPCDASLAPLFPSLARQHPLKGIKGQEQEPSPPLNVGILFSGGPAPGGHNVASGLFDALEKLHPKSRLFGFLGGPEGLLKGQYKELQRSEIDDYRNQGGFDLLGSGRTKIETTEQMQTVLTLCEKLSLQGLVIVGGDDSNTNAAFLAEFFHQKASKTCIVGVPKTIDADLKGPLLPLSFGFDTACRVYAEMIGNIAKDALSSKKYVHFIRLMGRAASHITLECALMTHPNLTWIGEEVQKERRSLTDLIHELADLIIKRDHQGKSYGVVLLPEGLLHFLPEIETLMQELESLLSQGEISSPFEIPARLSRASKKCFDLFPELIQKQLLLQRDPHGNVQLSKIETEKFLAHLVGKELETRRSQGLFSGSFHPMTHFLGYEGRCSLPSNFDANYSYTLGQISSLLIRFNLSGYLASVIRLHEDPKEWGIGAVPLFSLLHKEQRGGVARPVIAKQLVNCKGKAFSYFAEQRSKWALDDDYTSPGPLQFYEDPSSPTLPYTVAMELP